MTLETLSTVRAFGWRPLLEEGAFHPLRTARLLTSRQLISSRVLCCCWFLPFPSNRKALYAAAAAAAPVPRFASVLLLLELNELLTAHTFFLQTAK